MGCGGSGSNLVPPLCGSSSLRSPTALSLRSGLTPSGRDDNSEEPMKVVSRVDRTCPPALHSNLFNDQAVEHFDPHHGHVSPGHGSVSGDEHSLIKAQDNSLHRVREMNLAEIHFNFPEQTHVFRILYARDPRRPAQ